jgi:hypothetical protein
MYKHPTDRKAQRRRYYQENREAIREAAAQWYEDNKGTDEYKSRKRNYMVIYRRRKKLGA